MVDSSHVIVISSVRNEFEEANIIVLYYQRGNIIVLYYQGGKFRFKSSCLLVFLKIVEPQESAE